MHEGELLLLGLMVAVAALSVLAQVLGLPYPILLVLGGLVIGFVPGLPDVELPPELVLVLFLPPLLYYAAFFSSPQELRADLRAISTSKNPASRSSRPPVLCANHDLPGQFWRKEGRTRP